MWKPGTLGEELFFHKEGNETMEFIWMVLSLWRISEQLCFQNKKNIETTILKGNGWCSRYVAEWLNTSLKESTIFHVVNQKPNEHHNTRFIRGATYCLKKKCFLNSKNKENNSYYVFVPNSTTLHPSCSCKGYTSNLLPCGQIARVYVTVSDRI